MEIALAAADDLVDLARLLWLHAAAHERAEQTLDSFAVALDGWWSDNGGTHVAFLARSPDSGAVGMAWLAFVARVPRPGTVTRRSGDIQSVFVLPEHRGRGIGSRLVESAVRHATASGVGRVVVQSGRRAVPVYERLGFASSPQLLQTPAE